MRVTKQVGDRILSKVTLRRLPPSPLWLGYTRWRILDINHKVRGMFMMCPLGPAGRFRLDIAMMGGKEFCIVVMDCPTRDTIKEAEAAFMTRLKGAFDHLLGEFGYYLDWEEAYDEVVPGGK